MTRIFGEVVKYACKNTEQLGVLVEKTICKVVNIPFNTKRKYQDLPDEITNDISDTIRPILKKMKLEHAGNLNLSHDFLDVDTKKTVSVKTLMKGNRVCPQSIGQCSLQSLSEKLNMNFSSNMCFKTYFMENITDMMNNYLKHCFCCDLTLVFKFDKGCVYSIGKQDKNGIVTFTKTLNLSTSKSLEKWNESNTIYVHIDEQRLTLGEIQIHKNRNCIKFRYNIDTLIHMIQSDYISNFSVDVYNLKTKYQFTVEKKTEQGNVDKMSKLCFPSLNYIGSKMKLLEFIKTSICEYTGKASYSDIQSFADVCSGTGVVSYDLMRGGCKNILTNDIQHYAYMVSSVWTTSEIDIPKITAIVNELNAYDIEDNIKDNIEDGSEMFVYKNYTEAGVDKRMYLSKQNGYKVDVYRQKIETLKTNGNLNDKEYRLLIKLLLYAVSGVSNIASVYGAYLKSYKKVALKDMKINVNLIDSLVKDDSIKHVSYNMGIVDLLRTTDFSEYEVVYIDPPYVANRSYHDNYHLLETISRYDKPKIKGKTGLRDIVDTKSKFCSKREAFDEFSAVLKGIKSKYIFISYSSESIVTKDSMIELLQQCGWSDVKCYEKVYQRFKSNKNSEDKQPKNLTEYVFCGKRV
jgi:adenine-specific DNA-methyltransferase